LRKTASPNMRKCSYAEVFKMVCVDAAYYAGRRKNSVRFQVSSFRLLQEVQLVAVVGISRKFLCE